METTPRYIPTSEAAERHGVTQATIRRWLAENRLRGQKVGGSWVVEESSCAALERLEGRGQYTRL